MLVHTGLGRVIVDCQVFQLLVMDVATYSAAVPKDRLRDGLYIFPKGVMTQ